RVRRIPSCQLTALSCQDVSPRSSTFVLQNVDSLFVCQEKFAVFRRCGKSLAQCCYDWLNMNRRCGYFVEGVWRKRRGGKTALDSAVMRECRSPQYQLHH